MVRFVKWVWTWLSRQVQDPETQTAKAFERYDKRTLVERIVTFLNEGGDWVSLKEIEEISALVSSIPREKLAKKFADFYDLIRKDWPKEGHKRIYLIRMLLNQK